MKKEKIYLSGAISGRAREEYLTQFADAENSLRQLGYDVCNPTKVFVCRYIWLYYCMEKLFGKTSTYKIILLHDLWLLSKCDKICMLSGSESSKGAFLEKVAAETFGIAKIFVANTNTIIYFGKKEQL